MSTPNARQRPARRRSRSHPSWTVRDLPPSHTRELRARNADIESVPTSTAFTYVYGLSLLLLANVLVSAVVVGIVTHEWHANPAPWLAALSANALAYPCVLTGFRRDLLS